MIEILSNWAKSLGVTIVVVSIIEMILPNNKTKKYINVILGMFVIFNIISPIIVNKNKLKQASIGIENYKIDANNVDQTSMNERIQDLYEKELEKDIKNKLKNQNYNITSCNVKVEIPKNNEDDVKIKKIKLQIEDITNTDVKEIKKFLEDEYEVNEKCLEIR